MLGQGPQQQSNNKANMITTKQGAPDSSNEDPAAKTNTPGGPNRPRRRPRKLNKDPTSSISNEAPTQPSSTPSKDVAVPSTSTTTELEALKSRVRGLEAKVEELYKAGHTGRGVRSPRRRGKRKSSSNAQTDPSVVAGTTTAEERGKVVDVFDEDGEDGEDGADRRAGDEDAGESEDEEGNEELVRLEGELAVARRDLESYHRQRPRHQQRRSHRLEADDEDFVEDIPRTSSPGVQDRRRPPNTTAADNRQVTLTGSYRIPLPATVSMDDVRNIQSGVSAAQNVARSFLEQRRARNAAAMEAEIGGENAPRRQRQRPRQSSSAALTRERLDDTGKQSWGEWFGGYSMAISRAVRNIEAEAAVESQPRSSAGVGSSKGAASGLGKKRAAAAAGSGSTAAGKSTQGKAAGRTGQQRQRPASKTKVGGLSGEAVKGLVS